MSAARHVAMNLARPRRIPDRIGPTETDAARPEGSGAAAWLAGLLMLVYPIGALFPFVYKNIGAGDVFLLGVFLLGFLRFYRPYMRFMATGYGVISCMVLVGTGASILVMGQGYRALDAMAQFAVILWLMLPLVAVGIAEMKQPLRYFEAGGWLFFGVVTTGAFLLLGRGSELIFTNSGSNRYFLVIPLVAFEACLIPLVLGRLFAMRKVVSWAGGRFLLLLAASLLASILADSRTSIVVALAGALLVLAINRRPVVALTVGSLLAIGYVYFRESVWFSDMLGGERRGLLDDRGRQDLMLSALESLGTNMQQFFFGAGWQGSGFMSTESAVIIHNTYIQVAVEWGIMGLVFWLGIWFLPWIWLLRSRRRDTLEWQVALLTLFSVHLAWMFHPIATTRLHWLGFAAALGLAYRVHLQDANGSGPRGRNDLPRGVGGLRPLPGR